MSRHLPTVDVPRPCPESWDAMSGPGAARECARCGREVHDLASLTSTEVERLVATGERVCVRLTRDVDGAIVTVDRPPAWQTGRQLRAQLSGAAIAALISAWRPAPLLAAPQSPAYESQCGPLPAAEVPNVGDDFGAIAGTVKDQINGGFAGAIVLAVNESTGAQFWTEAGAEGRYRLAVPSGSYTVGVSCKGFDPAGKRHIRVTSRGATTYDAELRLPVLGEVVAVYKLPPEEPNDPSAAMGGVDRRHAFVRFITAPFRLLARLIGKDR